MKKHIHCDVIKAMAEGKQVQRKNDRGQWMGLTNPAFSVDAEYRVTPEADLKHTHHDAMLAWAEGHEMQCLKSEGTDRESWEDIPHPTFVPYLKYRIKPPVDKKTELWEEMEELLERMKELEVELCTCTVTS
ncbi:MAG: hypothetical protein HRU12_19745 [Phaeodactylibacter sp.]|nr:hypothetical protein [Phaeodactylibacter sp.]